MGGKGGGGGGGQNGRPGDPRKDRPVRNQHQRMLLWEHTNVCSTNIPTGRGPVGWIIGIEDVIR